MALKHTSKEGTDQLQHFSETDVSEIMSSSVAVKRDDLCSAMIPAAVITHALPQLYPSAASGALSPYNPRSTMPVAQAFF